MGSGRRAYDLLRGYVNREWERIQGVERGYAEQELAEALDKPAPMRRQADPTSEPPQQMTPEQRIDRARRILGVNADATFDDIRHAFEKLNRRSDPSNFAEGIEAKEHAAEIQKRVQWAYGVLTEGMDTTEKRFKSLEID